MNLQEIRNIEEDQKFLINGIEYVCTMSSGYANNPKKNFRFTDMTLPKKVRHSAYNELYFPCEELFSQVQNNTLSISSLSEMFSGNIQLTLF